MRLLTIHADYIKYEAKEKTDFAEDGVPLSGYMEECLVCFITVESGDNIETVRSASHSILELSSNLDVKNVVIYPYAHLSSDLANPDLALNILKEIEESLRNTNLNVLRAPFGWYKSFEIKCKGHPLSELSKTILAEETSKAIKSEKEKKSEFYILTSLGELIPITRFDFSQHENLRIFAEYEMSGTRVGGKAPHTEIIRRMELADYERGSDSGNIKYFPKGRLIKSLLEEFVSRETIRYGAMEVETPIMYDYYHPTLHSYLQRFPARQYIVLSGTKKYFLRFAACFGQFLMLSESTISYSQLPVRIYELTRYSFRREQSGEVIGLKRLRAFTMPDMHTLVRDLESAKEEFLKQVSLCIRTLEKIGLYPSDYEIALRFTKDFYNENREFISEIARLVNKPILVEMWNERFFYFILKFEINFIDVAKKASALSTVQIDVENAERYNITYVDENGNRRNPIILHASPSGAIERCIYAIIEKELKSNSGKPMLPVWLSPTQIRIIPVSKNFLDYCKKIYDELKMFRVDIDDRDISVGKKIRDAEIEWIPFIVVVGEKEVRDNKISVRIRKNNTIEILSVNELKEMIEKEIKDMPFKPLPLPIYLSKRPHFRG